MDWSVEYAVWSSVRVDDEASVEARRDFSSVSSVDILLDSSELL